MNLCYNFDNTQKAMTPIHLYNTLTKRKELFKPEQEGHVSMYHCGPTVYNHAHIGNLRAYIASDILRRMFELNGYAVSQVMNITDIGHLQHDDTDDGEDKMTLALKREGKELSLENMKEVALRYFDAFRTDLEKINILPANLFPFASEHIADDISFIQQLIEKENAYAGKDGIYFDTTSIPDYGRLGGIAAQDSETESRIGEADISSSGKKNRRDFALWKFNDALGYDAPFGKGFPGWHIECSVMSMKYLGGSDSAWSEFKTFDIHTGGIDHIPVHHNNEIAQTEAVSGKLLANYWLHNEHLIIEGGKKMAKSGESFITLQALEDRGISPLGFRYWALGAGYRTPLQFSLEALEDAERSYRSLIAKIAHMRAKADQGAASGANASSLEAHVETFRSLLSDDLNTPKAIAFIYEEIINGSNMDLADKIAFLEKADAALGLGLMDASEEFAKKLADSAIVPDSIRDLAERRLAARAAKDWAASDSIRDQIDAEGYEIKDVDGGYIVNKKLI